MRIVIAFFLALRSLRESVLSTALMIVAVAVAIGFEVPSVANLEGYRRELLAQSLTDGYGDIRVRPGRGVVLHDAYSVAARLSRLPEVVEATPVLGAPASVAGASWWMGVLAVGIPVLALLYISTLNRRRQIGLLTAMGFARADLFLTFLLQALILGTAGVLVGGLVAVALVQYLVAHPIFDWQSFVVRPVLTTRDLARTVFAILATAVVAGTYPAWRAACLDPSRILRGIE